MTRDGDGARRSMRRTGERLRCVCLMITGWLIVTPLLHAQSAPLYTNSNRFHIPFQFDAAEMNRIGAAEVQLHVSTSRGSTWSTVESVLPTSSRFTFDAPGSGEYWFAVRTIDRQGRPYPEGPHQPSLRVIVDRDDPTLSISVSSSANGDAEVSWQATDSNLDLSSLQLEYLDSHTGAWQPLQVSQSAQGRTSFAAPRRGRLMVRGSVSDLAGNSASAESSGTLTPVAAPDLSPTSRPDFRDPIAEAPFTPGGTPLVSPTARGGTALPTILPNMPHAPVPSFAAAAVRTPLPSDLAATAPVPAANIAISPPAIAGESVQPGIDNNSFTPPASNARRVNSRTFRIGYEVHDVGPSGVGSVELYITEDGGAKWFHYGTDPDRRSPFEVVVPRDGHYGFAIRVRNGLGVVADPPQPAMKPEISVVVDQSPPSIQLSPLQHEAIGGVYHVKIAWFAQDDRLAERPIALYQSTTANGPWEPITGWIENQGRFLWQVSTLSSRSVYIRVDAKDAAGNVTSAIAEKPLIIDTSRPTVRILEVESVGGASPVR